MQNALENHQEIQQLTQHINELILSYQSSRSNTLAYTIYQHLQQICAHPECSDSKLDRCYYLRLCNIWRLLARNHKTNQIASHA